MLKFFAVASNRTYDFLFNVIDSATFKPLILLLLALVLGFLSYQEPQFNKLYTLNQNTGRINWSFSDTAKAISKWQAGSPLSSPLSSPLADGENRRTEITPDSDASPGESPLATPLNESDDENLTPIDEQTSSTATPTWTATLVPTLPPTATPTLTLVPTDTPNPTATPSNSVPVTVTVGITPSIAITATLTSTDVPSETAESRATPIPSMETVVEESAEPELPMAELSVSSGEMPNRAPTSAEMLEREASLAALIVPFDGLLNVESLILSLLCLIFLSINGLGLTALVVTLFYVRSRREQMES